MRIARWTDSVVTRLVVWFCLGGLSLSIGLGLLQYQRAERLAAVSRGQRLMLDARELQDVLRTAIRAENHESVTAALRAFTGREEVTAIRVLEGERTLATEGPWPESAETAPRWSMAGDDTQIAPGLDLLNPTVLRTMFGARGRQFVVEMLIDGPAVRHQVRQAAMRQISAEWLLIAVLTLFGLLLLRRWVMAPLCRIVAMTAKPASIPDFETAAEQMDGEFGQLASAIGDMLANLNRTSSQLRQRERTLEHLYQFAPGAMLSIGPDGTITEANQRAASLFDLTSEQDLIGRDILDLLKHEDRSRFRQSIDRLDLERVHRCELRVVTAGPERQVRDVAIELAGVFDDHGTLAGVRLSILDICESKRLIRQVTEQRRLLDLIVNHMSDGILLVDRRLHIVAINRRLAQLLRLNPDQLIGRDYDVADFWTHLELTDPVAFVKLMRRPDQPAHQSYDHQFDTRDGSYHFHVIPVSDGVEGVAGQLWVVQDVTAEVRNRRLLDQQSAQLRALQRVGGELHGARGVEELMRRVLPRLYEVMGVEAVGIALRHAGPDRSRQLIYSGGTGGVEACEMELADAVAAHLMPRVFSSRATSFWTDLEQYGRWTRPFIHCGFDSLAATAVYSQPRTQGIVWIARRNGRRIERHHLYLLEAFAPIISTSLDNAHVLDHMQALGLTDPATSLPTTRHLRLILDPPRGQPATALWSLLCVQIDRFEPLAAAHGPSAIDTMLNCLANVLADSCRAAEYVIYDGEGRFLVYCPEEAIDSLAALAERLRERIRAKSFDLGDGQPTAVTVSIGLSGRPADGNDLDAVLHAATRRAHLAARAGGDRAVMPDPAHDAAPHAG